MKGFIFIVIFLLFISGCSCEKEIKSKPVLKKKTVDISVLNDIYKMVHIKGGTYQMGDRKGTGNVNERPVHDVSLKSFYLGEDEVTVDLYFQFYKEVGDHVPEFRDENEKKRWDLYERRLVQCKSICGISWYNSVSFCNWLSKKLKLEPCYKINFSQVTWNPEANGYRLPTEAEWEYAARGGHEESKQFEQNNPKSPHVLGLKKLHTDLGEWCWDLYGMDYYSKSPLDSPAGIDDLFANRVIRGNSWGDPTAYHYQKEQKGERESKRNFHTPKTRNARIGIRLARNSED